MILEDPDAMNTLSEFKTPCSPDCNDIEGPQVPEPGNELDLFELAETRIPASRRAARREWIGFIPIHDWNSALAPNLSALGRLRVIGSGNRHEVRFHPRSLFSELFKQKADAFYLVHNHPSGSSHPSSADRHLTRRAHRLAQELGLPLLGHLIVTRTTNHWIRMEPTDMGGHDEPIHPDSHDLRALRKTD